MCFLRGFSCDGVSVPYLPFNERVRPQRLVWRYSSRRAATGLTRSALRAPCPSSNRRRSSLPVGPDNLWRRVGPLVGGAQGRDRSCRRALAGPLRLSRPALDSGVSRARVVGSGGSRCRAPVCLIRQAIAMVRPENRQVMVSNRRLMAGIRTSCALRRAPLSSRESPYC